MNDTKGTNGPKETPARSLNAAVQLPRSGHSHAAKHLRSAMATESDFAPVPADAIYLGAGHRCLTPFLWAAFVQGFYRSRTPVESLMWSVKEAKRPTK